MRGLTAIALASAPLVAFASSCTHLSSCSGHGTCNGSSKCDCYNGWGSSTDIATYKAPDCSLRVCPSDHAWVDIPTSSSTAHALAECSNAGLCDRSTGRCRCFAGYEGEACQRSACPGTTPCSGHGKCVSIKQMATERNALPFGPDGFTYGGSETTTTWDEDKIYGCVCDSAWAVGYGNYETQVPQWFGPDCSLKHCPSGDDKRTADVDETKCYFHKDNGATYKGALNAAGEKVYNTPALGFVLGTNIGTEFNKCHVECSNRGTCDYSTGTCTCFKGYNGENCGNKMTVYS